MGRRVLVTRPSDESGAFAAQILSSGGEPVLCPLLTIVPFDVNVESLERPDALLLTSPQALRGVENIPSAWLSCPVFCVGEKTAQTARECGFETIVIAKGGESESLIKTINDTLPKKARILYLAGEFTSRPIEQELTDYTVEKIETYTAKALDALPPDSLSMFPTLDCITLFSARTGRILADLIERSGLMPFVPQIILLCLSPAVLESAGHLPWRRTVIAAAPTQQAMVEALEKLIQDK